MLVVQELLVGFCTNARLFLYIQFRCSAAINLFGSLKDLITINEVCYVQVHVLKCNQVNKVLVDEYDEIWNV